MGVDCGSQVTVCEYPVRFDTYKGCSHGCKYCFAQIKCDIHDVRMSRSIESLKRFIEGKRTGVTNWCDWAIPLHWGGLSDPFQPLEREGKASLECLELLRETQYPVIISTKGKLITEEPYISILAECNAVVQVSMVCPSYDRMEPGAPTFDERVEMLRILKDNCKRVIVRAQPYLPQVRDEFIGVLPRFADAGVHGVTVEGMKFKRAKPGTVKVGGDWCYPQDVLESHYIKIRDACHENGLKFYCAENRLRPMGDSMACCGCGDIPGFEGNSYNVVSMLARLDVKPTEQMTREGTARCFAASHQDTESSRRLSHESFAGQMSIELESYARGGAYVIARKKKQ